MRITVPLLAIILWAAPAQAATIHVGQGGDLQAAIDAAACGDTITLDAGATFSRAGGYVLPVQPGCSTYTTITTKNARIRSRNACTASGLATVQSTGNGVPTFRTVNGSSYWRLEGLAITRTGTNTFGPIRLGDGDPATVPAQDDLDDVPHHFEILGNYIYVSSGAERRGILLNSGETLVKWNCIRNFVDPGFDSQAVGGTNGPGPYAIVDNHLEAASENILFGGADPVIPDLVPTGILIEGNTITKPLDWMGKGYNTKNLIELKNARQVTIRRNTMSHAWLDAQTGFAFLLTVRNQDGGCPWCLVQDVTVEYNHISNVGGCFQITGRDDPSPSQITRGILIRHNFCQTNVAVTQGPGRAFEITHSPHDVTITRNTFLNELTFMVIGDFDEPCTGLALGGNVMRHGGEKPDTAYGIIYAGGLGRDALEAYCPGSWTFTDNVMGDPWRPGYHCGYYTPGAICPTWDEFRDEFVDYAGGDYRLVPGSTWLGVDWSLLPAEPPRGKGRGRR